MFTPIILEARFYDCNFLQLDTPPPPNITLRRLTLFLLYGSNICLGFLLKHFENPGSIPSRRF